MCVCVLCVCGRWEGESVCVTETDTVCVYVCVHVCMREIGNGRGSTVCKECVTKESVCLCVRACSVLSE